LTASEEVGTIRRIIIRMERRNCNWTTLLQSEIGPLCGPPALDLWEVLGPVKTLWIFFLREEEEV